MYLPLLLQVGIFFGGQMLKIDYNSVRDQEIVLFGMTNTNLSVVVKMQGAGN